MKRNKSTTNFWPVVAAVNILALTYPINLLSRAESADEKLMATIVLIGSLFLLMLGDAVCIVVAEVVGTHKR
jgi:hypothetical protein